MEEITSNILVETSFNGVTIGAILTPKGVIMIDLPLRAKDIQSWQSACLRACDGSDRMLILLDEHPDRTASADQVRCPILTHEKTALAITSNPAVVKMQGLETGAVWETIPEICSFDWPSPEITFTESTIINWMDEPILVEHHPGPSKGSAWVILPDQKVAFIGDTITPGQPPFFASANIELWLASIEDLKSARFKDFILISGRGKLATKDDIRFAQRFIKKANRAFERLYSQKADIEKAEQTGRGYIDDFKLKNKAHQELFLSRLGYGFGKYHARQFNRNQQSKSDQA